MTINRVFLRFAWIAAVTVEACCAGTISTSSVPAVIGTPLTVDVLANGVFDLYAFQFDLSWNPALLRAESVGEGPFLPLAGSTIFDGGTIDNTSGRVTLVFDTLSSAISGASGTGVLVSVSFTALAEGIWPLQFSNLLVLDSSLNDAGITATDGAVSIVSDPGVPASGVPEPGTLTLMGVGVCGAMWLLRRQASPKRRW
jgi:general secretion pathway protein D